MPLINMPEFSGRLLDEFAARGTARIDTPVIQPAAPFLDMAGEDLRRRIFLTESETGESLCLRPEFTIPVCLRHIESATGTPRRYGYLGEVFRQRREGDNEFYQAGIEDLGETNIASADARAVNDAVQILESLIPGRKLDITLGDQAVFEAVVKALGLPGGWQKRLIQSFGNNAHLAQLLMTLASPQTPSGLSPQLSELLAKDDAALIAHIDQTMQDTGYSTNASRSPREIAARLKEKQSLTQTRLDGSALALLTEFLSLEIPLSQAPAALAGFADAAGLALGAALVTFEARTAAMADLGVDLDKVTYRAAFGRPLDYYTGLVFEVSRDNAVLAGGGRFDRLMTLLGANEDIPAVGFSLWLDRIEQARAR
ncbi:ATP phosphoribosyltransferase regulatory subunit [Rhizobiales bacterium RZME27]|uniref:ATP phosphoribosyltransferase regulatory subunit n=1 Tax=Endobacterium cereale TaxID=2663029 RepID=A0A6A8ADC2_9HYPH|nr:ATP phosphoribosyltransferase regulatory subunit [Endobacterium cereale]MEB2846848.1 ATP phosphoribosyltransferase regulatory subunit [Endobacterium cereale]MQY47730.1 ATP phosphoribosyltransferase regulatory subunit [Endobacterium cereale]